MVVVVADHLPPAVRGRMKLWFVEPKPNVFVSGINDAVADSVVEYLYKHCPPSSGLMIFQKIKGAPGYKIRGLGLPNRQMVDFNGLQLICEKASLA